MRRILLIFLVLVGLSIGGLLPGWAANAADLTKRPANFYRLVYETDSSICSPALTALNTPNTLKASEIGKANSAAKLLLSSPLEVKWQEEKLPPYEYNTEMEVAPVDIDQNGKRQFVYRESTFLKTEGENDLIVAPEMTGVLHSDAPLSQDILKAIRGEKGANYIWITDESVPEMVSLRKLPPLGGTSVSTVMEVAGAAYIVMTEAGRADRSLKVGYTPIEVFLLHVRSRRELTVVCQFRSVDAQS